MRAGVKHKIRLNDRPYPSPLLRGEGETFVAAMKITSANLLIEIELDISNAICAGTQGSAPDGHRLWPRNPGTPTWPVRSSQNSVSRKRVWT